MSSIGSRIRSARKSAGFSQQQLAKTAGISQPYLAQIEREDRTPTTDVLRNIAHAADTSVAWLLGEATDHPTNPVDDPRLEIILDTRVAPGLRDLAKDETLCAALSIQSKEWEALRSLALDVPADREAYLLLLHTIRVIRRMM